MMNLNHHITNYFSISVKQVNYKNMIVNIKGNREEMNKIEDSFIYEAKRILGDNFEYCFTYDNNVEPKDIFVSSITGIKKL